jgi:uncharacterized protein (TIGR03032 family)
MFAHPTPPAPSGTEERTVPNLNLDQAGPPTIVRYQCSESLPFLLAKANCSFLISTYTLGTLVTVGTASGQMLIAFHRFDRPMGMATSREGIIVCTRSQVWFLPHSADFAGRMEPRGRYDAAFFARKSHYTGNILCHETAWVGKELWIVNTRFSCLCTLDPTCHFAPRWLPPFISSLTPEDRCHLNGLATSDGRARYVTALGETDTKEGWRAVKDSGGCLIDVPSKTIVARGLVQPHSPRVANGKVYVLHSGLGRLEEVDPANGHRETVCDFPGYTRGLSIHGSLAFVGLSKIRGSSATDGVPIAAHPERLKCGVWVVDLTQGAIVGHLEFGAGIDQLFDVKVIPGISSPYVSGPMAHLETEKMHWRLGPPG